MPALHYQHLYRRVDTGVSFSIIFGVIAATVVLVCAVWGFIIPKWRKKHPANPSRTKWNDGSILTSRRRPSRRIRTFPSHPAIKPLLSKPSTAQILPTYNPRIESPFPDSPNQGVTRTLPHVVRTYSAPVPTTSLSSHGLFTPVRRQNPGEDQFKNKYHTVPRASDAKNFPGRSADFGDAKDFILAVPEPLALKPREAGRPPAVKRHLEKYGTPHSNSPVGSDKHPHPNKLFHAVQSGNYRSSLCSSTSLRIDHRESDEAATLAAREVEDAVNKAIEEGAGQRQYPEYSSNESSKASSVVGPHKEATDQGSRVPQLARAGTVTRPKTPVDELRKFYTQDTRKEVVSMARLPRDLTTSTALTVVENSSENDSVSTPATSPTLPSGTLKLLPTPLRPRKSSDTMPPSAAQAFSHSNTMCSMDTVEEGKSGVPALQPVLGRKRARRVSQGFYHTGRRDPPAPLNIKSSNVSSSPRNHYPRRSLTDIGTIVAAPTVKPGQLQPRMRASSMYSQDTYGFNLVPSPTTPEFPSPMLDVFSDHSGYGNPFTGRQSVKTRVEEWTQRIHALPSPSLPTPKNSSFSDTVGKDRAKLETNTSPQENTKSGPATTSLDDTGEKPVQRTGEHLASAPGVASWI
ncbi:hypothetical protein LTR70_002490 [Exophiala xenobiotica]|uniref:Uncharacterized protein n=1 Tax=Lithohypha guttulata TaxID=1690604 RepID=A0ABR0KJU0_9EURO|nr:hypothetical protein LTR24_001708 [Lithohypha guttulata]KAK5325325.1 hypothetical protein LTR70_002490 [Exophiala xenobiotica]